MLERNSVRDVDVTRRPGDVAAGEGDLSFTVRNDVSVSGYSGYDGGHTQVTSPLYTNNSGEAKFLMKVTAMFENPAPAVQVGYRIRDLDTSTDLAYFYGPNHHFDSAVRIEDNWRVDYYVNNPTPVDVDIDLASMLRDEVTPE